MIKNKSKKNHNKKKSNRLVVIGIVIFLIVIFGVLFLFWGSGENFDRTEVDSFAQCLTDSGTVMYGAFWCPHCAKTKKKFGESFQYVHYIECDPRGENEQSELCIKKGIDKYDTWEFKDGSRVIGEPSFDRLAEGSGCKAPEMVKNG